jgi:hypothetical protein
MQNRASYVNTHLSYQRVSRIAQMIIPRYPSVGGLAQIPLSGYVNLCITQRLESHTPKLFHRISSDTVVYVIVSKIYTRMYIWM